jgi:hypothetical protein
MTATFFALALLSALNPKLFAFDLVLIENARPRLMFGCYLLGGMGIPFAFLGFRPEGTKGTAPARPGLADEPRAAAHRRRRHLRRAHMAISGLVRLLT